MFVCILFLEIILFILIVKLMFVLFFISIFNIDILSLNHTPYSGTIRHYLTTIKYKNPFGIQIIN